MDFPYLTANPSPLPSSLCECVYVLQHPAPFAYSPKLPTVAAFMAYTLPADSMKPCTLLEKIFSPNSIHFFDAKVCPLLCEP